MIDRRDVVGALKRLLQAADVPEGFERVLGQRGEVLPRFGHRRLNIMLFIARRPRSRGAVASPVLRHLHYGAVRGSAGAAGLALPGLHSIFSIGDDPTEMTIDDRMSLKSDTRSMIGCH